jgi:hypothetical protein
MANKPKDEQLGETDQKALAQQLLKQLDSNESLLVQVSLPQSHDFYSRDLTAGKGSRDQLEALAGVLFHREGASRTSLQRVPSQEQGTELREKQKPPGEIFVVEGQPGDVRQSLVQLVERADVRFEPVSNALLATQPAAGDDESGTTRRNSRRKRIAGGYGYGVQSEKSSGMDGYGGYPGMGGEARGLGNGTLPIGGYGGMNAEPARQKKANSVADKSAPAKTEETDQNAAVKGLANVPPKDAEKDPKSDAADDKARRPLRGEEGGGAAVRRSAPPAPADPTVDAPSSAQRFALENKVDLPEGPAAAIRIVLTDQREEGRRQAIPALAQGQAPPSRKALQQSESRIVHLLFRYRPVPAAPADAAEAAKE